MSRTPGFFHRLFRRSYGAMGVTHTPTDALFGLSNSPLWIHAFFATNITDVYDDNVGTVGVRVHPTEKNAISIFEFKVKPEFFRNGVATGMLRHVLLTYNTYARKIIIEIPKKDQKLKDFLHLNHFMLAHETNQHYVFVHYFNFEEKNDGA
jgi:ribosomal protein S18 acetylase RimI-like enzyme